MAWHVDKDGSMESLDFDFGVHKNHPSDIQGVPQHWTPENLAQALFEHELVT